MSSVAGATTWSSAYWNASGEVVEVTSDLQRYDDAEAELREKVKAAGAVPLYIRDERGVEG